MQRSTERILTTHAGRLPNPGNIAAIQQARAAADQATFDRLMQAGVADKVRQQIALRNDIHSDGEFWKARDAQYYNSRVTGLAARQLSGLFHMRMCAWSGSVCQATHALRRDVQSRRGGSQMPIPDILTLDFDGVLCDGMQEYFEASRRTYMRIWSDEPAPGEELFAAFRDLRPVIMTGWEMPLLLRALAQGRPPGAMLQHWEAVRDELMQVGAPQGKALSEALTHTLDDVRRTWIATTPGDWLNRNIPYCPLDDVRRLLAEPASAVLVTTKEGEFARQILDHWRVPMAGIQGKETGTHKCDNLRTLIAQYEAAHGRRPTLWFVEDRLETLQHVTTHADLDDVGLFLAAWGYNTPDVRASVQDNGRIRLLALAQFQGGCATWQ